MPKFQRLRAVTRHSRHLSLFTLLTIIFTLSLIIVPLPLQGKARAAGNGEYFAATGYSVSDEHGFQSYWHNKGGLFQYGYPITAEQVEVNPDDGKSYSTQWFERAVFEYHPENQPPYNILLRRLGALLHTSSTPAAFDGGNTPTNVFFTATRHNLNGQFLDYWQAHGGLPVFGYPLDEEHQEANPSDGKTYYVQWFERARLELHPENQPPYNVLLGLLGVQTHNSAQPPTQTPAPTAGGSGGNNSTGSIPGSPAWPWVWPLTGPHIGYGMCVQLYYADRGRILQVVKNAGFHYVKQQVRWLDIDAGNGNYVWGELDNIINDVTASGLQITLSVNSGPAWAAANGKNGMPADPAVFARFLNAMAHRYAGHVAAYEVWNEENAIWETGVTIEAGRYVELLKQAYVGIKTADPQAVVISGALTPTGYNDPNIAVDDVEYFKQMYAYQGGIVRNYFDVLGVHPGSNANPPDTLWPENPGFTPDWTKHESFYFRRVEGVRKVMENAGDGNKQMWLTEFGWSTENQAPGYGYGKYVTEQNQADYLVRAFQMSKQNYPWMGVMNIWNLNYATIVNPSDEKYPWSLVRGDWSPRPAYLALQAMPK